MIKLTLYGLILGVLLTECTSQCPSSRWSSYNGYCYLITSGYPESARSWYDAEDYCRTQNATLASIHSDEEGNFLLQLLKSWTITDYVWIGLHSLTIPNKFLWSDGSAVDYQIWETPIISNKCVMLKKTNGEWKDKNCGYLQGLICKRKEGKVVPTPPPVDLYVPSGNCPASWYQYGSTCYKFFSDEEVTWKDAKQSCESLGENHYLASIHSEEEQMFLTSLLGYQTRDAWIGLERSYTSKLEMWPDNSKYNYSNWMPGDGGYYWITQCAKMRADMKTAGKWEASMCNKNASYVCQSDPDPAIKEPSVYPQRCTKDEYLAYGEECYRIVKKRETWQQAQEYCKKDGGNLITVTDAFENSFLYYILEGMNENVWIGLNDKEGNGNYQWADKWPKLFLHWQHGEPSPGSSSQCVYANNSTRRWSTANCENKYPYVCKITSQDRPVIPIKQNKGKCPFPLNATLDFGGEYCYHLGNMGTKMWSSALLYCMQKGTTLASFHSIYETELLWSLIGNEATLMWIGLYQQEDGTFVWQNGDKVDFTNWATDVRQDGGCVYINSKDMFWVRQACNDAYKFAAPLCMAKKT